jgi:hypothetical protein
MTLTEILQLKEKYLQCNDLRAIDYPEKRYQEAGYPTERWELFNFLELMLQELEANGLGYPKVLLLRKKEIQGNRFTIRQPGEISAKECDCLGGWLLNGSPCPCHKGEPHLDKLRKWRMKI